MAIQHTVQAGDTVSAIAKRFNVPTSAVSGFRSNDPNVIFPGETLTIQNQNQIVTEDNQLVDPATVQSAVPQPAPSAQNVVSPTPEVTTPTESTANIAPAEAPEDAGAGAITETIKQTGEQAKAPTVEVSAPEVAELPVVEEEPLAERTFDEAAEEAELPETFFTPSGAEVTEEGEILATPEAEVDRTLGQFGISGEAVGQGFQTNPFGTLQDIITQVMQFTGLPDVRETLTSTANEIEELELERDEEIARIQDDPFSSVGSKRERAQNISDAFDKRINARVNKLTLLQSAQQDARQQAQFAASTAISLFGQERTFQATQIERALDRAEKELEAERELFEPLSVSEAKSLGVPFGTTRGEAFGITPSADVAGFTEKDIANNIIKIRTSVKSEQGFKDFTDILNAFQNTKVGFDLNNAAGDLAIVNGIAKILDPGSVIRPAEFETVKAAQGFFEQVANFPFRVASGRIAGADARQRFLELAEQLVLEKAGPLKTNLESSFTPVASGLGVDIREAVPEIQQLEDITRELATKGFTSEEKTQRLDSIITSTTDTSQSIEIEPAGFFEGFLNVFGLSKQ